MNLEEIMNGNLFRDRENIKVFPMALIIIIYNKYEDFLQIPFELNLNNVEKKYNLKSAIKYEDDLTFIIPNKNNTLIKGYFNDDKIQYEKDINEKDINNCFVYFYEQECLDYTVKNFDNKAYNIIKKKSNSSNDNSYYDYNIYSFNKKNIIKWGIRLYFTLLFLHLKLL